MNNFCEECGSKIVQGDKFCQNCGNSVNTNQEQVNEVNSAFDFFIIKNLYLLTIIRIISLEFY